MRSAWFGGYKEHRRRTGPPIKALLVRIQEWEVDDAATSFDREKVGIDLVSPTSSGMPGAQLIQQLLGWLDQIALWGALASVLVGAAIYDLSQNTGNYVG